MTDLFVPSRRQLLLGSGALFAWAYVPKLALASGRDPRFLTIVLRGALDGLSAVAPVGDPDWRRLRGDLALTADGPVAALPLDGFFALHPAMPNLHRLYKAGQATIVHAVATPYRERSHFDGQDVLESGLPKAGAVDTGWLNRALAMLTPADRAVNASWPGVSIGPTTPLVIRGPVRVMSWSPVRLPAASDDTVMRILDLYRHTDPTLAAALEAHVGSAAIAGAESMRPDGAGAGSARSKEHFTESAAAAAKFLARPDGPRIGALSFDGWDTHARQGPLHGQLSNLLGALDGAFAALESGMGAAWRETVVAVVTEFGRTARINGTDGTDHGTATVALFLGGALKGGRVIADWPGLADAQLYEGRDLRPTTDLRAPLKGLLEGHLGISTADLSNKVFPGSGAVKVMPGLLV